MSSDRPPSGPGNLFEGGRKRRLAVFAILTFTVLLGVASVGYAVSLSDDGSRYTGFYLLNENESGQLVAQDYSTTIPAERPYAMHVGIENHEGQQTQYTVVVKLQRMYFDNGTAQMIEEERLKTVQVTVRENQRWLRPVNVTPTLRGSRMRLVYLLYRDGPPAEPTMQNAYRETHVWINVTAPPNTDSSLSDGPPSPVGSSRSFGSSTDTSIVDGTPDAASGQPGRALASRRGARG